MMGVERSDRLFDLTCLWRKKGARAEGGWRRPVLVGETFFSVWVWVWVWRGFEGLAMYLG